VKRHFVVEADNAEEAVERYHDGHILHEDEDRMVICETVEGRDSYGVKVAEA
jgi:hypothetical protein